MDKCSLLVPGINAYVEKYGARLRIQDYVPILEVGGQSLELSLSRLERFFDEDDYDGINDYLESVISPKLEIP